MSYTDNPPQSKRALSLDDLVNHDENGKAKLQKINDAADAATQPRIGRGEESGSNQVSTERLGAIETRRDNIDQGPNPSKPKSRKSSGDDEETDTVMMWVQVGRLTSIQEWILIMINNIEAFPPLVYLSRMQLLTSRLS